MRGGEEMSWIVELLVGEVRMNGAVHYTANTTMIDYSMSVGLKRQ